MVRLKRYFTGKLGHFTYFYRKLGRRLLLIILFNLFAVVLDGIGITMFVPLLQFADGMDLSDGESGKITDIIHGVFLFIDIPVSITNLLVVIFLLFVLKSVFLYFVQTFQQFSLNDFMKSLLNTSSLGLRDLDYNTFIRTDMGRIQNSLTKEAVQVSGAANSYIDTIRNAFITVVYLAIVGWIDWFFLIAFIAIGLAVGVGYNYFHNKAKALSRDSNRLSHEYAGLVMQSLANFKYLKATFRSDLYNKKMGGVVSEMIQNSNRVVVLQSFVSSVREPIVLSILCAVIGVNILIYEVSIASTLVVLLLIYRAILAFMSVQSSWGAFLSNIGSVENMRDFEGYLQNNREILIGGQSLDRIKDIDLKAVNVSYGDQVKVIDGVSLAIRNLESIALVGESGAGKTTLVNIICGLVHPDVGSVLVNGQSIKLIEASTYRSRIGYVSQELTVFNGSIFENITFWDTPTEENRNRFRSVVRKCHLEGLLQELPNGEETLLGNNGLNLSGGQKQRIAIARELYRDIDLLILDEATSALDSETESEIKNSLERLKGELTVITIAHRLSTIRNVDRICLMQAGKIVDQGSFDDLLSRSAPFQRQARLQGLFSG